MAIFYCVTTLGVVELSMTSSSQSTLYSLAIDGVVNAPTPIPKKALLNFCLTKRRNIPEETTPELSTSISEGREP
jgi:hypothetical protein